MPRHPTLGSSLTALGVSRREVLGFCATTAALFALPPGEALALTKVVTSAPLRPALIWLSFQECTGCTESLTRAHAPTVEKLILELVSLDYHHTLQAASGEAAEEARQAAMREQWGRYLLVVDGSVPLGNPGYSTIAGVDNRTLLAECAAGAAAIVAVGSCAAFGGLPMADPNPTGAVAVGELVHDKPVLNLPGCPPIPAVLTAVLAYYLTFGRLPPLDALHRPVGFYGETIHERCYRRPFYDRGLFAASFDDAGARQGWCLFKLGCKGPTTHNACATLKWNGGVGFPIQAGHGCLGCSEPRFWDAGGFYQPFSAPIAPLGQALTLAAAGGAAAGLAAALDGRRRRAQAATRQPPATIDDLERPS